MSDPVVYVTRDPEIVVAVTEQQARQADWIARVKAALLGLSWADAVAPGGMFGPFEVTRVRATDPDAAREAGWRESRQRGMWVPRKDTRGDAARAWLADLGTCPTVPATIGFRGAPEYVTTPGPDFTEHITGVRARVLGDSVWIEYPAEPTDRNTATWAGGHKGPPDARWTRTLLSEYYAAREAADAAVPAVQPDPATEDPHAIAAAAPRLAAMLDEETPDV